MTSGYYFDISAFLILLCLTYAYFIQSLHKVEDNNIVFASMLCELLSAGLGVAYYIDPLRENVLAAPFYVASWSLTATSITLLVLYFYMNRAYNKHIRWILILLGIPYAADILFTGLASLEGSPVFRTAAYCCDLLILIVGVGIAHTYKKITTIERTIMLNLMLFSVIAATLIELLSPTLLIQKFVISLLFAEAFFNLKDPEEQFDQQTGLLGIESFREEIRRRFYYLNKHGGSVSLVLLAIHNTESFFKLLGEVNEAKLRKVVMSELTRIADGTSIYRFSRGVYLFMGENDDDVETDRIQRALKQRFESTFGEEAYEMELMFSTSLIKLPEMASDSTALDDLVHMAVREGRLYGRPVIDAGSLDLANEEYMRQVDEKVRNAVSSGSLEVYYQPIYSIKRKKFVSAEALLRLHDGDKFIPPDIFITVAENNGSIIEIDDYVVKQVCKMISTRNIEDLGLSYIELNLSVSDMLQDDIAEKLTKYTEMYHVDPSLINLEITETSDDAFTGVVETNVMKLSHLGFKFALDDFGTGYSSLSRIIMMPFDIIKLDRTIVQAPFNMETDGERNSALTLLESSADMIGQIGSETVAEGVETKDQSDKMEELGIDLIQGFYYARPMPEPEFINAVKAKNRK